MLRSLLRRFGVLRATAILTLASSMLSMLITAIYGVLTSGTVAEEGLCTFEERLPDLDAMPMRADEALFAAKRGGKNNLAVRPMPLPSAAAA